VVTVVGVVLAMAVVLLMVEQAVYLRQDQQGGPGSLPVAAAPAKAVAAAPEPF